MNRNEAIKIYEKHFGPGIIQHAGKYIDFLEEIGLIKLETPKTPCQIIAEVVGYGEKPMRVVNALIDGGYEIRKR